MTSRADGHTDFGVIASISEGWPTDEMTIFVASPRLPAPSPCS
ncbi:D-mannonate oxidoreductase [Cutibacterium acnes JCM 18918]|nr:D-mannonate oxidoreductase [Cutibacterium acnes JCM 18918]